MKKWMTGIFKKIVVGAENLQEMVDAYQEAKKQGIPCSIIEDAGLTEFGGQVTITAVAIGPDDPEKIDKITGKFPLL
jgi:PTH2 family peptidyl-tRNA hydrolase